MEIRSQVLSPEMSPRTFLGESPRWSGTAWWWLDAEPGNVWTRPAGCPTEQLIGGAGPTTLVHPSACGAVVAHGLNLFEYSRSPNRAWSRQWWTRVAAPDGHRLNDGTADAEGRLWVGSVDSDLAATGCLIRIDRDGTSEVVADGFTLSNGMAWHPSGDFLFHADTFAGRIWAHHIDARSGALIRSQIAIDLGNEWPDGISIDSSGGIWVAVYGTGQVRRYEGDRVTDIVSVPPIQVTSVAIGGISGTQLLITTAREGYSDEQSAMEPEAGCVFTAEVSVAAPQILLTRPVIGANTSDVLRNSPHKLEDHS